VPGSLREWPARTGRPDCRDRRERQGGPEQHRDGNGQAAAHGQFLHPEAPRAWGTVALHPRIADARLRAAVESSISQRCESERRLSASLDPAWRTALGLELRAQRRSRGLTQEALGAPLSKGFVSAVEHGRAVPSLSALRLMTDRLGVPLGEFFRGVDRRSTGT
jgi:DNA-binding transcriptional regulator YiaG